MWGSAGGGRDGVCIKDSKEIYVEVSAGKGNHSKWNINGIHFLAMSPEGTLWKCREKNHFVIITVIYIREQHWIYKNVSFYKAITGPSESSYPFKGNFWARKLIEKNGPTLAPGGK